MATSNITASANEPIFYAGLTPQERMSSAAGMAGEIAEERDRFFCLTEAIRIQLLAPPGRNSPQPVALGLARHPCLICSQTAG